VTHSADRRHRGRSVSVEQQDPKSAIEAVYEFSSDLDLQRASLSDGYWDWHRRLESQHAVTHADHICPERGGLAVESWDPSHGWRAWTAPLSANATPQR
jgi:hypothetical protein